MIEIDLVDVDSGLTRLLSKLDEIGDIDLQKEGQWFINQVYRRVSKQHGRRYTYTTPPATERKNLRKRTGRLLQRLKDSKFSHGGSDHAEVGFDISGNDYASIHIDDTIDSYDDGSTDEPLPTGKYTVLKPDSRFVQTMPWRGTRFILVPLRRALNPDGSMAPVPARSGGALRVGFYSKLKHTLNWEGEDVKKIRKGARILYRRSGRGGVPLYILSKSVKIPARVKLGAAFEIEFNRLYQRIEERIANV